MKLQTSHNVLSLQKNSGAKTTIKVMQDFEAGAEAPGRFRFNNKSPVRQRNKSVIKSLMSRHMNSPLRRASEENQSGTAYGSVFNKFANFGTINDNNLPRIQSKMHKSITRIDSHEVENHRTT
jgi:hypothetical protein